MDTRFMVLITLGLFAVLVTANNIVLGDEKDVERYDDEFLYEADNEFLQKADSEDKDEADSEDKDEADSEDKDEDVLNSPNFFINTPSLRPRGVNDCVHKPNVQGFCLVMGAKSPSATLVYQGEEQKFGIPLIRRDGDFTFKLPNSAMWDFISFINVTNKMEYGTEGYVALTRGGIGHRNATFSMQSQRGHGYDFIFEIFGDRDNGRSQQNPQQHVHQRDVKIPQLPQQQGEPVIFDVPMNTMPVPTATGMGVKTQQ